MFHSMARGCGKQENAPEDEIEAIIAQKPTNSHVSKCIQACLAEAGGFVSR